MKFRVKQSHIRNGCKGSCSSCPIALCIQEQLTVFYVRVMSSVIVIDDKNIKIPKNVVMFIREFDSGQPVKPIKFTIKSL